MTDNDKAHKARSRFEQLMECHNKSYLAEKLSEAESTIESQRLALEEKDRELNQLKADFLRRDATAVWALEKIEQLKSRVKELREIVEQAHMAGQIDAGVDPSYSNARAYYDRLFSINQPGGGE